MARPQHMERSTPGQIPLDLYDRLHDSMFGSPRSTDKVLGGEKLEGLRRADIEDTFARFAERIREIAPELEPEHLVQVVARIAFVERSGFEDGVKLGVDVQTDSNERENAYWASVNMARQEAVAGW